MTQNRNQNIYSQTRIIYMAMQCLNFFKKVDSNGQIFGKSSKGCVLEVDLEYFKELQELDKIKIKREMLSEYQLKIADLYNIPIGNVKKIVPNFFDKKSMCFIIRTYNFT